MNVYAVLQESTLLGYLFILGLVFGRARQDPVNRAFRIFLLFALGWAITGLIALSPVSIGHELLLKRAAAVCWISINFWFLRFVYLLLKRPRDLAYWIVAGSAVLGSALYVFTDLAIQGFVRYDWGLAAVRGPLHSAISVIPMLAGGYALLVLARAIPHTRHPAARKSVILVLAGGTGALAFGMVTNAILPVAIGKTGFPELGSYGVFILCPFLYRAVTRHDFLSITIAEAAERLFEDLRDGIVLVDHAGTVVKMNPAAMRLLHGSVDDEGKTRLQDLLPESMSLQDAAPGEFVVHHNGSDRYIAMSESSSTKHGIDLGRVVLLRDVTEEKHTEELLRRSRDELQAEVVRRTDELRHAQKMEAIGTLAGGIAHDFNNILAAIVGFSTAAKEDLPEGHPQHADLDEVLRASARARDIVRQLLSFARRKEPQKKTVDVSDVVSESIRLLQASLPATIGVDFVPSRKRCAVVADPTQLQQVVLNLATNAYHAMEPDGGVLRVSVARMPVDHEFATQHAPMKPGPHICLAVSDSGSGMTPSVLERIFDPFFTTKSADQGTGLGLATAMRIAQEHGGTITAESDPAVGSTFRVYLPVAEVDLLAESVKELGMPAGTESIMIVDDKEPVAASTARLLRPLGYRITIFTDPDHAIAAVKENPKRFDLIITDQTMPRVTGMTLAKRVSSMRSDLPVVLVSGYPPPGDLTASGEGPVRAFMAKPLDKGQLARTMRLLLDASKGPPSSSARRTDPNIVIRQRPN